MTQALTTRAVAEGFPARIAALQDQLTEAKSDLERLMVRDVARAAQAAAEVLRRKDIQVYASLLVSDAERAIAKANPPRRPGRKPSRAEEQEENESTPEHQRLVWATRKAHANLPDERFEELKQDAVEKGEPLTRKFLNKEARKLERSRQGLPPVPESTATVQVRVSTESMQRRIKDLEAEVEDLQERVTLSLDPDQARRYEGYQEEITALRVQVGEWQSKYETERGIAAGLRKRLAELEGRA